jgi:hypothetical protein
MYNRKPPYDNKMRVFNWRETPTASLLAKLREDASTWIVAGPQGQRMTWDF